MKKGAAAGGRLHSRAPVYERSRVVFTKHGREDHTHGRMARTNLAWHGINLFDTPLASQKFDRDVTKPPARQCSTAAIEAAVSPHRLEPILGAIWFHKLFGSFIGENASFSDEDSLDEVGILCLNLSFKALQRLLW
jgi:hypothetical protein